MKYLGDSFSVHPGANKNYRDNYDSIFKKKERPEVVFDDAIPEAVEIPPAPEGDRDAAPPKKKNGKGKQVKKPRKKKTK